MENDVDLQKNVPFSKESSQASSASEIAYESAMRAANQPRIKAETRNLEYILDWKYLNS